LLVTHHSSLITVLTVSRIRHHLHIFLAEFLYYSGLLAAWRFLRTRVSGKDQVCVLGLHRILSEADFARSNSLPGMLLKESTFVSLLEFVKKRFRVIPIHELSRAREHGPCYAFTFDDGWKDNYTGAYPWMRKHAIPATIFLVTGLIGGEDGFWPEEVTAAWSNPATRQKLCSAGHQAGIRVLNPESEIHQPGGSSPTLLRAAPPLRSEGGASASHRDSPPRTNCGVVPLPSGEGKGGEEHPAPAALETLIEHLKHMPSRQRDLLLNGLRPASHPANGACSPDRMLTWDEVNEMSQGGIDFGAHTVTHPLLTYEDQATVEREIREAKRMLEERLHKKVRAFAYPNGDWNTETRRLVVAAGYDWAFTTQPGWCRPSQDSFTVPRVLLHEGNVTGHHGKFSPAMFTLTTVVSGQ
jgi:peptidoglycan/xylan/chitin deacetylase (PgdA/CDA1 family)